MKDVIIIGAGVVGCAIARELSKYQLNITVLEKEKDVSCGASKANSGIVHAGEDPEPGTLKAKMNVAGNPMFDQLQKELHFPFRRNGSFVLCFEESKLPKLKALMEKGLQNGVPKDSMHLLTRAEAIKIEPHLSEGVTHVLLLDTGGIVSPYEFTIALAENAAMNGVTFELETEVIGLVKKEKGFEVKTNKGTFESRYVINAAGIYSDQINNWVSQVTYHITPKRGEYLLLDKIADQVVDKTLFQLPTEKGKGILVTPTVHGNLLLGPTAEVQEVKEERSTTSVGLKEVLSKAALSVEKLPTREVITSFAGQRAHEDQGDFVLGEAPDVPGFINALGVESPGLTSSPAIAVYLRKVLEAKEPLRLKKNFNPNRAAIMPELSEAEQIKRIQKNPRYATVVCRCETVTEGDILEAIHRPVGATTLDGIKRRTRAGMGRCQCGFCMNRLVELLSEELHIPLEQVQKDSGQSYVLTGDLKEELEDEKSFSKGGI